MSEYSVFANTLTHLMEREFKEEENFQPIEFEMVSGVATWVFKIGTHEPYRRAVLTITERAFDAFERGARAHDVLERLKDHFWKRYLRDMRYEDGVELQLGQDLVLRRVPATED